MAAKQVGANRGKNCLICRVDEQRLHGSVCRCQVLPSVVTTPSASPPAHPPRVPGPPVTPPVAIPGSPPPPIVPPKRTTGTPPTRTPTPAATVNEVRLSGAALLSKVAAGMTNRQVLR